MRSKFLICESCGNLVEVLHDSQVIPKCCDNDMQVLEFNNREAALEKHIPVIEENEDKFIVKVGDVLHPMLEEHYIKWIYVETNKGIIRFDLKPDEEPIREFKLLNDEKIINVYAYCNLHGCWQKEV